MPTDEEIVGYLHHFIHDTGYVGGQSAIAGAVPGTKTFEVVPKKISDHWVSFRDVYCGKEFSGGQNQLTVDGQPILLISFGGEHIGHPNSEEISKVTAFLKEAVKNCPTARAPRKTVVLYENDAFSYVGFGFGDLRHFRWGEMIFPAGAFHDADLFRENSSQSSEIVREITVKNYFRKLLENPQQVSGLIFYHYYLYQGIG